MLSTSNKRGRIALIVGFLVGAAGFAGIILIKPGGTAGANQSTNTSGVHVVVATQDIPVGTAITKDMVDVETFPANTVPAGAYPDTGAVVGSFAVVSLQSRQVIVPAFISSSSAAPTVGTPGSGSGITLTKGNVAMAMTVDPQIAVGYYIQPGDHVDFILNVGPGTVKYGFQDVLILKVGGQNPAAQGANGASSNRQDNLIIVELPRRQAEELAAMESSSGSPITVSRLVLRPHEDWGKGYLDSGTDQPYATTPNDAAMGPNNLSSVFH